MKMYICDDGGPKTFLTQVAGGSTSLVKFFMEFSDKTWRKK